MNDSFGLNGGSKFSAIHLELHITGRQTDIAKGNGLIILKLKEQIQSHFCLVILWPGHTSRRT